MKISKNMMAHIKTISVIVFAIVALLFAVSYPVQIIGLGIIATILFVFCMILYAGFLGYVALHERFSQ
jgi:hypothetical protein